ARLELAPFVNFECNLAMRDTGIPDMAFNTQSPGWNLKDFLHGLSPQLHRFGRTGQSKGNVHDVSTRREHETGRGSLLLLDQLRSRILLHTENAPMQPAVDDGQIATKPGTQGERTLARRELRRCVNLAWIRGRG